MNKNEKLLQKDELEFIQSLYGNNTSSEGSEASVPPILKQLNLAAPQPEFLNILPLAQQLSFEAELDGYLLVFKPYFHHIDGQQVLQLGYPLIMEQDNHQRARRVPHFGEILVNDVDSNFELAELVDISVSGLSLKLKTLPLNINNDLSFSLRLTLPEDVDYVVSCRVVRTAFDFLNNSYQLALEFQHLDTQTEQAISAYVFRHTPNISEQTTLA
tara:strand:- start:8537 stop:9181 length:645 start_codon:yes stop_codon:yes gene_type:complete